MEVYLIGSKHREAFRGLMSSSDFDALGRKNVCAYGLVDGLTKTAAGALVVEFVSQIAMIRSIYVSEQYRCYGGAGKLLDALIDDCVANLNATDIRVLLTDGKIRSDEQVASFLLDHGFSAEDTEQNNFVITLEKLRECAFLSKNISISDCLPLREVSDVDLRRFSNKIAGRYDVYTSLPINKSRFNNDISVATFSDGEIDGILLAANTGEFLDLDYCISISSKPMQAVKMFYTAAKAAVEILSPDMILRIAAIDKVSSGLCRKILPDADVTHYVRYTLNLGAAIYGAYSLIYDDL